MSLMNRIVIIAVRFVRLIWIVLNHQPAGTATTSDSETRVSQPASESEAHSGPRHQFCWSNPFALSGKLIMVLPLQFLIPVSLGLTLLVSGALKLRTAEATQAAAGAFGLPKFLQKRWMALAFPITEILIGTGLLFASGQVLKIAGWFATGLFVVFTLLVARVVARKEEVDCNCFGALTIGAVGWGTLIRNLLLTFGALVLTLGLHGPLGVFGALNNFAAVDIVWLAIVVGLSLWLVAATGYKSVSSESESTDEISHVDWSGKPIPDAQLRNIADHVTTLRDLSKERAQILVFGRPGCQACGPVIESVPGWRAELGAAVEIKVVTSRSLESLGEAYPSEEESALHDGSSMVTTILGIPGVPSAILLGTNGLVGAGPAVGPEAVAALVDYVISAVNI